MKKAGRLHVLKIVFLSIVLIAIVLYLVTHVYYYSFSRPPTQPVQTSIRLSSVVWGSVYKNCSNPDKINLSELDSTHRTIDAKIPYISTIHPFIQKNCQSAIDHFSLVNGLSNVLSGSNVPVSTMCLLNIIDAAFAKANVDWVVWGRSALGEFTHGGPVPWDSGGAEVIVDGAYFGFICLIIRKFANSSGLLDCETEKLHIKPQSADMPPFQPITTIFFKFYPPIKGASRVSPCIRLTYFDTSISRVSFPYSLFSEKLNYTFFHERSQIFKIPLQTIFPAQLKYFGGYFLPFPNHNNETLFKSRGIDPKICIFDRENEQKFPVRKGKPSNEISCCLLSKQFPFKKSLCLNDGSTLEIVMIGDRIVYWVLYRTTASPVVNYRDAKDINLEAFLRYQKLDNLFVQSPSLCNTSSKFSRIQISSKKLALFSETKVKQKDPLFYLVYGAVFCKESHIIDQWIQHHVNEGVEHFILVDNCGDPRDQAALQPYVDKGLVTVFLDRSRNAQKRLQIELILPLAKVIAGWLILGDLDEFFYSTSKNTTLAQVIRQKFEPNNCGNIVTPMLSFGTNGHLRNPASVIASNTKRLDYGKINKDFPGYIYTKTITRIDNIGKPHIHYTYIDNKSGRLSCVATDFKKKPLLYDDVMYIRGKIYFDEKQIKKLLIKQNHYSLQSEEFFFEIKAKRGDVNENDRETGYRDKRFFHDNNKNDIEDLTLFNKNITLARLGPAAFYPRF